MDVARLLSRAQAAHDAGRREETREILRALHFETPNAVPELRALGQTCARLGESALAFRCFRQAVQVDPQSSDAHFSLALLYLQHGNYEHGFVEYEWRLNRENCIIPRYAGEAPFWDGRVLDGEALMLHCEQGFGDNLQFIRFLPQVRERVKTIHLACHPELVRLFSGLEGVASIVTDGEPVPRCEFHCPLLSLPRLFKVTLETLPRSMPYLPVPRVEPRAPSARKRIGLVWRASRASPNGAYRSVPLADLRPLTDLPLDWVSLQKDPDAEELQILREDFRAEERGNGFRDFQDTAECVQDLDAVISVDTSVVHVAGALGRPTHLLLPRVTDWRWLLNRSDSPWYPTMTIYRQEKEGDWSSPLAKLRAELVA
jgi:tetratricopeptide (TPR) repeat protein